MIGRAGMVGLVAAGCLAAVTTAVPAGEPAAQPPNEMSRAAEIVAAMGPAPGAVGVPHPAAGPDRDAALAAQWQRRWEADRATIARLAVSAERVGPALVLLLDHERTIGFVDEVGSCAGFFTCLSHRVDGYIAEHGFYVLQVEHGEGGWTFLIDRRDGNVEQVAAPPVLSRDRSFALAWYPSLMDGPKLDVINFKPTGLEIEPAIVEGSCWPRLGVADAAWVPFAMDAETIVWTRSVGNAEETLPGIALKRIGGQWQVACES